MRRLGLALAIMVVSGTGLAAADSKSEIKIEARIEAMLKRIDPADRLEQVCDYAAAKRIGRDKNPYHPDRAVIDSIVAVQGRRRHHQGQRRRLSQPRSVVSVFLHLQDDARPAENPVVRLSRRRENPRREVERLRTVALGRPILSLRTLAIEIAAASNHLGENMAGRSAFVAAIVLLAVFEFSADVQAQQSQGQKNPVAPVLSHPVIKEPPTQPTGGKPKTGAAGVIPKPGLAYTFTLNFFKITDTRSLHSDTDFVSISVALGSKPPINPAPKSVGDLNNGTYQVNMSIPDITAADTDAVAFTYAIVNSRHDKNDMETQLRSALGSAARRAAHGAAPLV